MIVAALRQDKHDIFYKDKEKTPDDSSSSAGQSHYTSFCSEIDKRYNPIGCSHIAKFHESLFVPVGVKSGGSFPGFIAQKKKQAIKIPTPKHSRESTPRSNGSSSRASIRTSLN